MTPTALTKSVENHIGAEVVAVEPPGLSAVVNSLRSDFASRPLLDEKLRPEDHVAKAVREKRVPEALHEAKRASATLSASVRAEVVRRKEALLAEVDAVEALEKEVATVSTGLDALASASSALSEALASPFVPMTLAVRKLNNIQRASALLRAVSRFRNCVEKLEHAALFPSFSHEAPTSTEALPPAAVAMKELEDLLEVNKESALGLEKVDVITRCMAGVRKASPELRRRAAAMLKSGMTEQDQQVMAAAVLAFHAVGVLPERVNSEVARLLLDTQAAIKRGLESVRVASAFAFPILGATTGSQEERSKAELNGLVAGNGRNLHKGAVDIGDGTADSRFGLLDSESRGSMSQVGYELDRDHATSSTPSNDDLDAWGRLDGMLDAVRESCSKAILLQQVMSRNFDDVKHVSLLHEPIASGFIDAVGKALSDQISALARTHRQRASAGQVFRTLAADYPRLRSCLSVLAERVYVRARSCPYPITSNQLTTALPLVPDRQFVRKAFLSTATDIETHYFTMTQERVTTAVADLFSGHKPPAELEAVGLVRLLAAEMTGARGQPDMVEAATKNVAAALRLFKSNAEDYVAANLPDDLKFGDRPGIVSHWPMTRMYNGLLSLNAYAKRALGTGEDGTGPMVDAVAKEVEEIAALAESMLDGPFSTVSKHLSSTLQRMHTEDLSAPPAGDEGCSIYAMDVCAQLNIFGEGVIPPLVRSRSLVERCVVLANDLVTLLIRHVCLFFPITDVGRNRLATDIARVESAMESICPVRSLGWSYSAVRALRELLLTDSVTLFSEFPATERLLYRLRPSDAISHILSRCRDGKLLLPYQQCGDTPGAYVHWLANNSEEEAWARIEAVLDSYEGSFLADASRQCPKYVLIARTRSALWDAWKKNQKEESW